MTQSFSSDPVLTAIARKVAEGTPLDKADALHLLRSPRIMEIGALANTVRQRLHGRKTYYGVNLNLNYTNVCELRCPLCAFSRDKGTAGAYTLSPAEIETRVRSAVANGIDEVHIVGGLNPDLDLGYYEEMLRSIRRAGSSLYVVGFTATEYDYIARRQGLPLETVLTRFREAGVNALPGGGAEVFAPEVRGVISPRKMPGKRWLEVMKAAHHAGLKSNATLLYGHIESPEQIVDHLSQLRSLQEETGGFKAFVPLAFHPENTQLSLPVPTPSGFSDIRIYATARLFLHNIPHLKALWMYLGESMAQTLLDFGVDDIGSTYIDEKIVHAAGATTERSGSETHLQRLIRAAGKIPVRTASDYGEKNVSREDAKTRNGTSEPETGRTSAKSTEFISLRGFAASRESSSRDETLRSAIYSGRRITEEEALALFDWDLPELGMAADFRRRQVWPDDTVGFILDRIINYSNRCEANCRFCAFHAKAGQIPAYDLSLNEILDKVRELVAAGGTQVMLQGGLHPDHSLSFYVTMVQAVKQHFPNITLHSFSAAELTHLARRESCSVDHLLDRLQAAGLDSVPGASDLLVDRIRQSVSPHKCTVSEWMAVMDALHRHKMYSSATMTYGLGETLAERIAHLQVIRDVQDRTGIIRAFIPWSFSPARTELEHIPRATGVDYLKIVAIGRIFLDNVVHIQAGWLTEGIKLAQVALAMGANDMGGILTEERVVKATGIQTRMTRETMITVIRDAGRIPVQRDSCYRSVTSG